MASTRKSAKRSSRKKGKTAKRATARKRPARKATKRRSKTARRGVALKRRAKKGLKVARKGIDTVRQAGERTWKTLKSTTAHVVEGVRERLGEESGPGRSYP